MDDLGVTDVPLVAIAKGPDRDAGREWFHMEGRPPFQLPPRDPALYYLQRLRDEAHRFAITTHRAGRSKTLVTSELDEVPGIGAARKRALLNHFGSARVASSRPAWPIWKMRRASAGRPPSGSTSIFIRERGITQRRCGRLGHIQPLAFLGRVQ